MTYLLSKILPLFLLPVGLCLILVLLGFIARLRWPFILSWLLLYVCSLGLVSQLLWRWLESPWIRLLVEDAPSADAIVVLSGGHHPAPGIAHVNEWHDPDRFLAGVDLYRAGKAPLLFFTGGATPFYPGQPPEGERYLLEAERMGVPVDAMASTFPVVNTSQEASAIRLLLPNNSRILLVTSAFHMQRAQRLMERQGLTVVPFPVDFHSRGSWAGSFWDDPTQWVPTASSLYSSSKALRELMGRFVYRTW